MRENAYIIKKYDNNKDKLSEELINNFETIYDLIIKDEVIEKNDKDYFYDKLRYIIFKEIKKIPDINYRYKIFEKLLESDEMIKKSNDILQILLKNYVKKDKCKNNRNNILNSEEYIVKLIDNKLKNNFVLSETLLYFFEKNSLNYLNNIIGTKKEIVKENKKKESIIINLEDEPLDILKDCIELLNFYIFEPKKLKSELKEIGKLYCLGYIKSFMYTFIKGFDDDKYKSKEPNKIIDVINGDNSIYKMIRIYIYKMLYNYFKIDIFVDKKMIEKYKLNDYKDFNSFIKITELNNIYKIDYLIKTLNDDDYIDLYKLLEKYKKDDFKNKIKTNDFNIEEGIDNFYVASYNFSLSNLQMENLDINKNFYNNICEPLFKEDKILLKAIQLFYDPKKYKEIKNSFKINSKNIKALLFGLRYCLNELSSKNTKGIYFPLYNSNNINYLKDYLYPGNDTKPNKVYSSIINHFKIKPNEGCYVCLCKNGGYYHSVKSGFPGYKQLNMTCPKCKKPIGTTQKGWIQTEDKIVNRDNYYRIFKDDKEIEEIKKDKDKRNKLKEIKFMTLEQYKEKYIKKKKKKKKEYL